MRQKAAPTMIMSCNLDLERMYCFREVIQLEYKRMYVLTPWVRANLPTSPHHQVLVLVLEHDRPSGDWSGVIACRGPHHGTHGV